MVFTACARAENTPSAGAARAKAGGAVAVSDSDGIGNDGGGNGGNDGGGGSNGTTGTTRAEKGLGPGPDPGPGPGLDPVSGPVPPLSLQEALVTIYSEAFLEGPICSTLLVHHKYPMSVAADTVVRVLLSELFLVNRQVHGLDN